MGQSSGSVLSDRTGDMALSDTAEGAKKFTKAFESRHKGELLPNFTQSSLRDARSQALVADPAERRNLCIFLDHTNSPNQEFSSFLCDPQVTNILNEDYLLWGWDLTQAANSATLQGSIISEFGVGLVRDINALRAPDLPCLVIVSRARGQTTDDILFGDNYASAAELAAELRSLANTNNQQKTQEVAEGREREEQRQLVREQDDAYDQSLREDRAKAERAEQEKKLKQEEAKRMEDIQKAREEKRNKIKLPKPPNASSKDHITVRFRLEDGSQTERRFWRSDKVADIINFAIKQWGYFPEDFMFSTNFPRVLLNNVQKLTIQQAKLQAQEIVRVIKKNV